MHNHKKTLLLFCLLFSQIFVFGQTNIRTSTIEIENILKGNYKASDYDAPNLSESKNEIVNTILNSISADSLKAYIIELNKFNTRHSASDTVSKSSGIGASRRWGAAKFEQFSKASNNRLEVGYLDFDVDICGVQQHRNVLAVLPGSNPEMKDALLIEGHLDSRCESACDTNCIAKGIEDNASGTALVLELARVLPQIKMDRTIVFMLTTGEEQGLHGGRAFAKYAKQNNIELRAVQNNDVIGGIICGKTASPPGCPGENKIDSTQVRIFSSGAFNSKHKQFARYSKLQYEEELKAKVSVPMTISIMAAEDRTGRGGDHIPFREEDITAIRFTSAHEHGDGHNGAGYTDRQHTQGDVLGKDNNNDGKIDEYYIDFNYLARNTQINAISACMAATGPVTPTFKLKLRYGTILQVDITDPNDYNNYRIALHTLGHDWDEVKTISGTKFSEITVDPDKFYFVSIASVDQEGIESLFTGELNVRTNEIEEKPVVHSPFELLGNKPNPFDFATTIAFKAEHVNANDIAIIEISDMAGKLIKKIELAPKNGINEVLYKHGYGKVGQYNYSLFINGELVGSKRLIFAN